MLKITLEIKQIALHESSSKVGMYVQLQGVQLHELS